MRPSTRTDRRPARPLGLAAGALLAAFLLALPAVQAELTGSGNVTDVVQLSTSTGSIAASALASTAAAPVASGSAFTVTNSGSNVDTFIRYAWQTTPYYGSTSSQTSIALRGTTYYINDLLWYKQETVSGAGTTTTSEYFSPLVIKNAASIARVTWTSAGNACTAWTGSAAVGFLAAAAGSFTFKYHAASSQTDDAPSTSDTFYYCLDTTNTQVYLGKSTAYGSATLVKGYTTNSVLASLQTYQYPFLSGSQSNGNNYCLTGYTGSGTSATPDLAQCQKLAYSTSGAASAKLYPLFDPPAYFPSANQAGGGNAITFGIAGTQWNPYAYSTTNTA